MIAPTVIKKYATTKVMHNKENIDAFTDETDRNLLDEFKTLN